MVRHSLRVRLAPSPLFGAWALFTLVACGDGDLSASNAGPADGGLAGQTPGAGGQGGGDASTGAQPGRPGDPDDGVFRADAAPQPGSDVGFGSAGGVIVPGFDAAPDPEGDATRPPPSEDLGAPPPPPLADLGAPPPPAVDQGVPPPVVDPPAPPPLQVFHNQPGDGPVQTIQNELLRLIGLASAGSELRLSMYEWGQDVYVTALQQALGRNVDVRIVLDGEGDHVSPEIRDALAAAIGNDRITYCPRGACIGTGINHNKFLLFSRLDDGSENVVVQGSHNFKASQNRRFNHLVVVRGDAALYREYRTYWTDLRSGQQNLDYYRSFTGDSGVKGYFFPRADGDLMLSVLDNVHCDPGAEIHVAMAFFKNDRLPVAQKLRALHDAGCSVRAVFGNYPEADADQSSPGASILNALRGLDVRTYDLGDITVHSKYLLIRARYGEGAAIENLVFAGSHNYTEAALRRNDEALMRLEDAASYQAFLADWTLMRSRLP
ncbi:phospholipase D-like domain-containing protein [Myxococcota bacterium]|nr:phospholipase D-like domain-containing protein [Myxococcota bacterium]